MNWNKQNPYLAKITSKKLLSGKQSNKEVFHYEISLGDSGIIYQPGDSVSFANSVKQVSENYSQFVENTLIARNTLCWNLDSQLLQNIYAKILIEQ